MFPIRSIDRQNKITNIAKGLWAVDLGSALERPPLGGDIYAEQRAAFLVRKGESPTNNANMDSPACA